MPTRSADLPAQLTDAELDARKKYLALACACDRVELALAWRPRPDTPLKTLTGLVAGPWLHVAASALTPLLPKKLRAAAFLYRLWRARQ
jgi:hypothetical protein